MWIILCNFYKSALTLFSSLQSHIFILDLVDFIWETKGLCRESSLPPGSHNLNGSNSLFCLENLLSSLSFWMTASASKVIGILIRNGKYIFWFLRSFTNSCKKYLARKIEVFRDLYSDCSCVYLFFSTCFSLKSKYLKIMCACVLTNQRIAGSLLIGF